MSKKAEIMAALKRRERVVEIKSQSGFHRIILQVDQEGIATEIEKLYKTDNEPVDDS